MKLFYLPVKFQIHFEDSVYVDNNPLFVLRGLLGKNLRGMCCVSKKNECTDCMFHQTCVYSYVFETIMEKEENIIHKGTDRASHPYAFTESDNVKIGEKIKEYSFTLTLFGKVIEYLPYIFAAFVRAGKEGMFKSRTKFCISDVLVKGESILLTENSISTEIQYDIFDTEKNESFMESTNISEILLQLLTPLRFKTNGLYLNKDELTSFDFFRCLYRRYKSLFLLYGQEVDLIPEYISTKTNIIKKEIKWTGDKRYSSRQQDTMHFGGYEGTLLLSGPFSKFEIVLIQLAQIANAGKNTNFGLGRIKII